MAPIPTRNSGKNVTDDFEYTSRGRCVVGLTFVNQGTNSNVDIEFGGGQITLAPRDSYRFNWDHPYVDETDYTIQFSVAGAGTVINKLRIIETAIV